MTCSLAVLAEIADSSDHTDGGTAIQRKERPGMRNIIITDLTRFSQPIDVCTAGTDVSSKSCIRPMPYLKMASCAQLGLLPGAILSGDFVPIAGLTGPHQEDAAYSKLRFVGPCTSAQFRDALHAGLFKSVEEGFAIKLGANQKHVPVGHPLTRSIITIAVKPDSIRIVEDGYKPGKIRVHFSDGTGRQFRYLAITDLGFHRYAERHFADQNLPSLNAFIGSQPEAYVRLGLSRAHQIGSTLGYWMQVNGIYTFPDFIKEIRSYK